MLATTSYFVATKGFDYVKDYNWASYKKLLEENGSEVRTEILGPLKL
jgi:hypothetical protein